MSSANRLLIVDDEAGITSVIARVARELGFEVGAINDSAKFEDAIAALDPTIIMLDISMPGRDGTELIGLLAANKFGGKVVVMSGTDARYIQMSSTIATVRGLKVAATLVKPFRVETLRDLLARLTELT